MSEASNAAESAPPADAKNASRTGRHWSYWPRRIVMGSILTLLAYFSGVAATMVWPTAIETTYYTGHVSLRPAPSSTVLAPTVLGDVEIEFDGLLPATGIRVDAQVKSDVTDLFVRDTVGVEALNPSPAEVRSAVGSAVRGLMLKFVGGVLLVFAAVWFTYLIGRRRRLTHRQTWQSTWRQSRLLAAATVVALALPLISGALTYRPHNIAQIRTTGLLGTVRSQAGLLTDVQARAQQVSRYVTNALALSQALQTALRPPGLDETPAVRVLFVSDIHGANQYPIMKRLIETEKIDAVVDSGDLVNFGTAQEAEAAGFFDSIRELGVPYLFVRGNHDATSATDNGLLDAMARIPNVRLLEPRPDDFQQYLVKGLSFAGFNDPRYYGDSDTDNDAKQKPRQQAFVEARRERPMPDVLVSHEPAAVEGVDTPGLRVNGHLHTPDRKNNRITVGSFTAGGLFGARVAQEADAVGDLDGEQNTATYYFDIGVWGADCSLINLTRYSFKSIVEGQPAYDDLSVINGRSIVDPVKNRTCG